MIKKKILKHVQIKLKAKILKKSRDVCEQAKKKQE
jgi:hypothetical protein